MDSLHLLAKPSSTCVSAGSTSWSSQAAHASQQGAQAGQAKQHMRLRRERKRAVIICREGMPRAEAEDLVASALALAASRDGSSGGLLRLVTVSAAGAERRLIPGDQVGFLVP